MLGHRVHPSLLCRRLGSTHKFPRDRVAQGSPRGPWWRCGGPWRGGRRLRGRGKTGSQRAGGRAARKAGVPTARLDPRGRTAWGGVQGRYLPLRSAEPAGILRGDREAAPAAAPEPCPRDAGAAGAPQRACSVPPSGRAPRASPGPAPVAHPASSPSPGRLSFCRSASFVRPSLSRVLLPARLPPSHQRSGPFSIYRLLTC